MSLSISLCTASALDPSCHRRPWSMNLKKMPYDVTYSGVPCSRRATAANAARDAASAATAAVSSPASTSAAEAAASIPDGGSVSRCSHELKHSGRLLSWGCKRHLIVYFCVVIGIIHSFSPGYAEQRGLSVLSAVEPSPNGGEYGRRTAVKGGTFKNAVTCFRSRLFCRVFTPELLYQVSRGLCE